MDVVFERVDTDPLQPLEHEVIGSATSPSDVAYVLDPGEVAAADTIDMQATCTPACDERSRATISLDGDDDVTPPVLSGPDVATRVTGVLNNPFDPFIARDEVSVRYGETIDHTEAFVPLGSSELEAMHPAGGTNAFVEIEGGIPRRFCFDADVIDTAGNETVLARELCVELDPSTAPPWGMMPPPPT